MRSPRKLAGSANGRSRSFSRPSAVTMHRKTCQKSKKRLSEALLNAKAVAEAKKKRRLTMSLVEPTPECSSGLKTAEPARASEPELRYPPGEAAPPAILPEDGNDDDSHFSMMARRPWVRSEHRLAPLRFRDTVPEPPTALPLPQSADSSATINHDLQSPSNPLNATGSLLL
ncbi:hypothetical protein FA95DRAFT_1420046 [Auriscalpium vulgare]|uniref:Uncharacterized protein n=1 Tax=Auriscalpium vulgare TaxID=40419 RepID=A0ACB8R0Y1_9AGAM|nr:hypothetical protein FA95DRAFT_1420046 [Auriscalpium vulgare]